jgi:hypothetical protein
MNTFRVCILLVFVLLLSFTTACSGPQPLVGYQGYLTNASGTPITGTKNITFKLYQSGGNTLIWEETHATVNVNKGMFNVELGSVTAFDPAIYAQPLDLEIIVDAQALTPRQKLVGSPYAMTLVADAVVASNSVDHDKPSLTVANHVNGTALGLASTVDSGYLIRGCVTDTTARGCSTQVFLVKSDGQIYSAATSKIAVSPLKMVHNVSHTSLEFRAHENGYITLRPAATGSLVYSYLPVDLPSTLYGTQNKLASAELCYKVTNTASFITEVHVRNTKGDGSLLTLISNVTDRKNTTWSCFTITPASPVAIDGPVMIAFRYTFGGTGAGHEIHVGKITLNLTQK